MSSRSSKVSASNVYTKQEIHYVEIDFANSLNNKSDKTDTCINTDVDVLLSISQAGINTRVLIKAVAIKGKF